jgi:hypothetical protein
VATFIDRLPGLSVDRQIEHRQVTRAPGDLQLGADRRSGGLAPTSSSLFQGTRFGAAAASGYWGATAVPAAKVGSCL